MSEDEKREAPALPGEVWRGVEPVRGCITALAPGPGGKLGAWWWDTETDGGAWLYASNLGAVALAAFLDERARTENARTKLREARGRLTPPKNLCDEGALHAIAAALTLLGEP